MNKYLSSLWIAPVLAGSVFLVSYSIYYLFFMNNINDYIRDFGILDCSGYFLYAVLLTWFGLYRKDFISKTEKKTYFTLIALTIMAILREAGAQKWVPTQDTTMLKLRFFTNPDNPFSEKIISAAVFLLLFLLVIYLARLYTKPLIIGFLNKKPMSWTLATLFIDGVTSKFIDRLPNNMRSYGFEIEDFTIELMHVFEETGELLLPALGIIALLQFHAAKKQQADAKILS